MYPIGEEGLRAPEKKKEGAFILLERMQYGKRIAKGKNQGARQESKGGR